MQGDTENQVRRRAGLAVFVMALMTYTLTVNVWPFPGESSRLIIAHLGLDPFPATTHPWWGIVARSIAHGSWLPLAFTLNLLSAVCGALGVYLLYRIVSGLHVVRREIPLARHADVVAGGAAALYLMVSTPFWYVSSRAHTLTFDLLLLLGALACVLWYTRRQQNRALYSWSLLCGMGCVEYPTMLPWTAAMAVYLWRRHRGALDKDVLPRVIAFFALSVSLSGVAARARTGMGTSSDATFWGSYVSELGGALSWVTWLYILMVSVVPFALAWALVRQPAQKSTRLPLHIAQVFVLLIALSHLYGFPGSVWHVLGDGKLMVVPYVLFAVVFGLMLMRGYVAMIGHASQAKDLLRYQRIQRYALMLVASLLGIAGLCNSAAVETESSRTVHNWAASIVQQMGDREYLVTKGSLDDAIVLAAEAQGRAVRLINLDRGVSPVYRAYLASLFEEPRYKGLARISPEGLVHDMLASESGLEDRVALMVKPQLWESAGYAALPFMGLYLGVRPEVDVDLQTLMKSYIWQWGRRVTSYRSLRNRKDSLARVGEEICRIESRMANDLGVFVEQRQRADYARKAYEVAREFDFQNISALVNAHALEAADHDADELQAMLRALHADSPLHELFEAYGRIARGDALRLLASARGLSKAALVAWSPELDRPKALLNAGKRRAAQEALQRLVYARPELSEAWALLGVVAFERGDQRTLKMCLDRMREHEEVWASLLYVQGVQAHEDGHVDRARELFEEARAHSDSDVRTLEALVKLAVSEGDLLGSRDTLGELLAADPASAWGNFVLGTLQLHQREYGQAEDSFRRSIERKPLTGSLNSLAWTLHLRGAFAEALRFCAWSLEINEESYATWDTYGVVLMRAGRSEESEKALIKARSLAPMAKGPQIHLVELLIETERPEAAAILARRILDSEAVINRTDKSELEKLVSAVL